MTDPINCSRYISSDEFAALAGYDSPVEAIGEAIRRYRISNRLTQKQLGNLIGVSTRTLGRWERGEREPLFLAHWVRLCDQVTEVGPYMPDEVRSFIRSWGEEAVRQFAYEGVDESGK